MFQQFLASALVAVAVTNTTSVDNLLTKEVLRDNQNVKVGVIQSVEESLSLI